MRPKAFANNEVRNSIPIHVPGRRSVRFRKHYTAGTFFWGMTHNHVFHKTDLPAAGALLLKPCQSPAMRLHRRHDIIQSVAVYVIHAYLRAACRGAAPLAKRHGMVLPQGCLSILGRLLPPPIGPEDIDSSVAIDIARADPVRCPGS